MEDASHWLGVYRELYDFKLDALERARERIAMMSAAARREAEQTDLVILTSERDRFRRRLDFWERRHRELRSSA